MFGFKKKKVVSNAIVAPVNGELIALSELQDGVFSSGMMGQGYAVVPSDGNVVAPINGTVVSIFPTKHALTFKDDQGHEILLHLGIDTVELAGKPFVIKVQEGQSVTTGTQLAQMDLAMIQADDKNPSVILIWTNLKDEQLKLTASGTVAAGEAVAELK
ncbi:PTS glucose transporter subunit IIA [Bombilactobacillus folatiphilus]|uniref:PTS glucose transporter subunit IIA n=1 Tax=Bombilactobacillus folatiphilus TaxID=2923362 RepID=A0ABY4P8Q0_9LACO|nr:PTS glucose transporter subunit IIA [Bombilactobacillus folatiphilus]UQS81971.1 PTS glucose transporter subunit IIA [Bombilactobacillus folatiphilus]